MLANGATLGYKTTSTATTYTNLAGLKQIPDLGVELEKVDNTCLTDTVRQYEMGIGDAGDLDYVFKFTNTSATDAYRVLNSYATSKAVLWFQEQDADGTKFAFSGQVAVRRNGGGVNDPVEFTASIALQSAITVTNPA